MLRSTHDLNELEGSSLKTVIKKEARELRLDTTRIPDDDSPLYTTVSELVFGDLTSIHAFLFEFSI